MKTNITKLKTNTMNILYGTDFHQTVETQTKQGFRPAPLPTHENMRVLMDKINELVKEINELKNEKK